MSSDFSHNVSSSLTSVSDEWQKLLTHFEWGQGFSFIVILVPNPQDAEIRRQVLERTLAAEHKTITQIRFANPEELTQLSARLLDLHLAEDTGAIWVSAVVSEAASDFPAWQSAWREAVARLNQFRNHIQQRFPVTLLFVGAPWLAETIRTYAPDLWSVRTLVVEIESESSAIRDLISANQQLVSPAASTSSPNVILALQSADKLRGKRGREAELVKYLIRAGEGLYAISDYQKAEEVLIEAVEIQQRLAPEEEEMADGFFWLGNAQTMLHEPKAALHLEKARTLYQQAGNIVGEADSLRCLGDVALFRSQHEVAQAQYQEALILYRRVKSLIGAAACTQRLGDVALARSKNDDAKAFYAEALLLYQRVGNMQGAANCIQGLGEIALRRSDHEEARKRYLEALPLYRRVGDVIGEANCIWGLGEIALRRSQFREAESHYEEALLLCRRVGYVLGEANCLRGLGGIARSQSQLDLAQTCFEEALLLYRRIKSEQGEANCLTSLGEISLARSQDKKAQEYYEKSLPLYRGIGDLQGEASSIRGMGDIAKQNGKDLAAKQYYSRALALYQLIPAPYSIGLTHHRLAQISTSDMEKEQHVEAARAAWLSVGRADLVQQLDEEFGSITSQEANK